MDWKKWFERNAFFGVIGACVATGIVVGGVVTYNFSEKLEILKERDGLEIANLNSRLASIVRSMGHDEYLDVRKLVGHRSHIEVPPTSKYFDDVGIYAPTIGNWVYSKSTELELAQAMGDAEVGKDRFSQKLLRVAPIHLWRAPETLAIKGYSNWKNIFPYAYVMRVSIDDMKKAIADVIGLFVPPTQNIDSNGRPTLMQASPKPKARTNEVESFVQDFFRGDIAGVLLSSYLSGQLVGHVISSKAKSTDYELLNVQKVQDVVYCAIRKTLVDVRVQNTPYHHYYIYGEQMIILDGPDVVLVTAFIPTPDPSTNSEYFHSVSGWFDGLRVLVR